MKITKLGHCCLLLELKGVKILTDPGIYTEKEHSKLKGVNYIFITHEHSDHYHLDSLKILMQKNPDALVYTNTSVSRLLAMEGIYHHVVKDSETVLLDDGKISVRGIGMEHAMMHRSVPLSENTGFFFDERLFYPGDSLSTFVNQPVDILALPVAGPWVKISDSIDYALEIKPKYCFPVHDHIRHSTSHNLPARVLAENGIEFFVMEEGDSHVFK
jgi:L-ascorbate metabolism protein UlaG (beta-lactamase superfamily)